MARRRSDTASAPCAASARTGEGTLPPSSSPGSREARSLVITSDYMMIADIWLAFIAYSHYDGARAWDYPGSDRPSALERLKRLAGRSVFACHEQSIEETRSYVDSTGLGASFSFLKIPFRNHPHAWPLRHIP